MAMKRKIETLSKIGFWFKIKAQLAFQSAGILLYFEELKRENNTEIGIKDIFEIGSKKNPAIEQSGVCRGIVGDITFWLFWKL